MMTEQKSMLDVNISPYKQLGVAFGLAIALMLLSKLSAAIPYSKTAHILPWTSLCGAILFYALVNCVLSFGASTNKYYWAQSIMCYVLLLGCGGLMAWWISGVGIYDAGSVSWLYVVLSIGYLVLLSIANMIRFVVYLAKKG